MNITLPAFNIAHLKVSDASTVSFGVRHLCALVAGGQVVCWGDNSSGQLGVGSMEQYPIDQPAAVSGISSATGVAAGTLASCAIMTDGSVDCWGEDWSGQGSSLVPTPMSGLSGVVTLSMHRHACALLQNGDVACLGESGEGQAGEVTSGASTKLATPRKLDLNGKAKQIAVGRTFSCALREDERVLCWGSNAHGQLGRAVGPDELALDATPAEVGLEGVVQLVTGDEFACALQKSGAVSCWGSNADGQLGIGVPSPVFPNDTDDAAHPSAERVRW